jgi:hypothetical protein
VRPRYKIRSRYYRETDACCFEIKVKQSGDETIKRQRPYDHADHGTIPPREIPAQARRQARNMRVGTPGGRAGTRLRVRVGG